MKSLIRIGTRGSALALWQASQVQAMLKSINLQSELIVVSSVGDKEFQKPLYEMGVQGIFTKELDSALMRGLIDIAVHSLKDVPTQLPNGIVKAFIPKRGAVEDVLVPKKDFTEKKNNSIATSSLRRAAQWKFKNPNDNIIDIRGNVPTRLKKLIKLQCEGAIMAKAGLVRLDLLPKNSIVLDWMVPAAGQGAIMVNCLVKKKEMLENLKQLNDEETELCVTQERNFLRKLEGGCSAPIGAYAKIQNNTVHFKGNITQKNGKKQLVFDKKVPLTNINKVGIMAANELLVLGAKELLDG